MTICRELVPSAIRHGMLLELCPTATYHLCNLPILLKVLSDGFCDGTDGMLREDRRLVTHHQAKEHVLWLTFGGHP